MSLQWSKKVPVPKVPLLRLKSGISSVSDAVSMVRCWTLHQSDQEAGMVCLSLTVLGRHEPPAESEQAAGSGNQYSNTSQV